MSTVLVVDDHPAVLRGVSSILEKEGFTVIDVCTSDEAVLMAKFGKPVSVVIADLTLSSPWTGEDNAGNTDGLAMIEEMRKYGFNGHSLIYTMHDEPWNVRRMNDAGVDAVVFKGEAPLVLIEAVKTLSEGKAFKGGLFRQLSEKLSYGVLSEKEHKVLEYVAEGKQNNEIATDMVLSEKAVEYHRSNILRKLSVRNMAQAVGKAMSLGMLRLLGGCVVLSAGVAYAEVPQPKEVDLGLSVIWADCNLGAATPYEEGGAFAFGETSVKENYTWETYKYCDGEVYLCHDIGENISGTEYDAAKVLLGNGWRLPTLEESNELAEMCDYGSFEKDGAMYGQFIGPNGGELIMPICGYMSRARRVAVNEQAFYLTGACEYDEGYDKEEDLYVRFLTPITLVLTPAIPLPEWYANASLGGCIRPVKDRTTSVEMLSGVESESMVEEIYTLQGVKVASSIENLTPGAYIIKKGSAVTKRIIH